MKIGPSTFPPRTCARCSKSYTPTGGRQRWCDACRVEGEKASRRAKVLAYRQSVREAKAAAVAAAPSPAPEPARERARRVSDEAILEARLDSLVRDVAELQRLPRIIEQQGENLRRIRNLLESRVGLEEARKIVVLGEEEDDGE